MVWEAQLSGQSKVESRDNLVWSSTSSTLCICIMFTPQGISSAKFLILLTWYVSWRKEKKIHIFFYFQQEFSIIILMSYFQVGNIFFLDTFLNGAFLKYGTEVVKFSGMNQENRTDPMIAIFPRVTKCTFHKFGPSGSIQKHDALCILALNILNEKIFIFLWFWLVILSALSGLALLYSSMVIVLPGVRETILKRRFRFGTPAGVSSLIRKTQVLKINLF